MRASIQRNTNNETTITAAKIIHSSSCSFSLEAFELEKLIRGPITDANLNRRPVPDLWGMTVASFPETRGCCGILDCLMAAENFSRCPRQIRQMPLPAERNTALRARKRGSPPWQRSGALRAYV